MSRVSGALYQHSTIILEYLTTQVERTSWSEPKLLKLMHVPFEGTVIIIHVMKERKGRISTVALTSPFSAHP